VETCLCFRFLFSVRSLWAMGKKRMCGSADVATGKMRIFSADIESGCVGKKRMCGCDLTFTLSLLFVVCVLKSQA